jgi:CheY-like chemotaxis protein
VSKRILVVEDTDDNHRILHDLLTAAGFDLLEAADGEAGIAMAGTGKPDLILLDIQVPVIDGYEAARRIKGNPALRHIRSLRLPPMRSPATRRRHEPPAATVTSPSPSARANSSAWCER